MHWSAGCLNQHVCVYSRKLCVIETIYQKPIIGGLLSLVALLSNNTAVNPFDKCVNKLQLITLEC